MGGECLISSFADWHGKRRNIVEGQFMVMHHRHTSKIVFALFKGNLIAIRKVIKKKRKYRKRK